MWSSSVADGCSNLGQTLLQRGCVLWFMLGVLPLHPYLQPEKTSLLFTPCRLMAPLKDSKKQQQECCISHPNHEINHKIENLITIYNNLLRTQNQLVELQ